MTRRIVFASHNVGKYKEMHSLIVNYDLNLTIQTDYGVDSIEETGKSFIENAILKARHASSKTGYPALADDSGLEVDCLQGAPGIYSARYAGENADFAANIEKLLVNMRGETNRQARFVCALAWVDSATDATPKIYTGFWSGEIAHSPSGTNGFGYDPIFYVPEFGCTASEITPAIKQRISHRAAAIKLLINDL